MTVEIQDDEAFVGPQDQETAIRLLKAAEDAGLDPSVVRTTTNGFIVPRSLVPDEAEEEIVEETEEESDEKPDEAEETAAPKPRGRTVKKES